VTYGAVMSHNDSTGRMVGMKYGETTAGHGATHPAGGAAPGAADHAGMPGMTGMQHGAPPAAAPDSAAAAPAELALRMLADPAIRRRAMADSALRRTVAEAARGMPAAQRARLGAMLREGAAAPPAASAPRASPPRRRPAPARASPRPAPEPAPRPAEAADPHAGHDMPPVAARRMLRPEEGARAAVRAPA
jgi:hypothetical protein